MIRLRRAPEPDELRRQRTIRLAEALLWVIPSGGQPRTDDGYKDETVKKALVQDTQHGLCAYCGAPVDVPGYSVEHFRPRAIYWWLTWTWENLWVCCPACQLKSDDFELREGSERLSVPGLANIEPSFDVSREGPLLLDPAVDDPPQHLRVGSDGQGRWWWEPVPGSERGRYTWRILKLDRNQRVASFDRLQRHLKKRVEPRCNAVATLVQSGQIGPARSAWTKLCTEVLDRQAPFLVPTWWYSSDFHRSRGLDAYDMGMPSYPDDASGGVLPRSAQLWAERLPELPEEVDEPRTRLLLYYVRSKRRVEKERLEETIVALCRTPRTSTELAALLSRNSSSVRPHLLRLAEEGRLVDDSGSWSVGRTPT